MCRRVTCERCGKRTFAGCGAHIEQVLADVPRARRCQCQQGANVGNVERTGKAPKSRFWPF
jgi:hypothetical protein